MGQHEAHGEGEGGVVPGLAAGPLGLQPVDGAIRHVLVVDLVGALARPRLDQADPRRPRGAGQLAVVDAAAAEVVGAVIAHEALGVAVELVGAEGVHAADQGRPVAAGAHGVGQGGDGGVEDVAVGPDPVLEGVAAGEGGHARRHAQGRGAVAGVEDDAPGGEAVEVGGVDQLVAVAAGHEGAVLVGVQVEEVGPLAHVGFLAEGPRRWRRGASGSRES